MAQLKLDEYAQMLCVAKEAYNYPAVTYDFMSDSEIKHDTMLDVEERIRVQLFAQDLATVKDGLSNVLYWGHATAGYQWSRVNDFRERVTQNQLIEFSRLMKVPQRVGLEQIGKLRLPQFGNASYALMPFNSKILMFTDPQKYTVLDNRLADFGDEFDIAILENLKTKSDVSIRLTKSNVRRYHHWADWCGRVASSVNALLSSTCKGLRAVDVERAIYHRIPNKTDSTQDATEARLLLAGPKTE